MYSKPRRWRALVGLFAFLLLVAGGKSPAEVRGDDYGMMRIPTKACRCPMIIVECTCEPLTYGAEGE